HGEREQRNEHLVLLHDDRHSWRGLRGRIRTDDEIALVDVEQLGVDARNGRGVGLIVVIDDLDLSPEQTAVLVGRLFPDFGAEQRLLAVRRQRAGQRHGKADLDRLAALRQGAPRRQRRRNQSGADTRVDAAAGQFVSHELPPQNRYRSTGLVMLWLRWLARAAPDENVAITMPWIASREKGARGS